MRAFLMLLVLATSVVAHAAGVTAHIGCWSALGIERVCAGDTIICLNTAQSDLALRFTTLQVGYTVGTETVAPIEEMGLPTTFRVPLSDEFGVFRRTPPFYVVTAKPNAELDVVYVVDTEPDELGRFVIHAVAAGEVDFDSGVGHWSAFYNLGVQSNLCSTAAPLVAPQAFGLAHHRLRRHMHRMHVRWQR